MAQYLKDEVRTRILEAGLREFAAHGFEGATMAGIARGAGVSAGNLYRYYDGKTALLEAVVPDAWVARFRALLRERVEAAERVGDVAEGDDAGVYAGAADALLAFTIEHRLRTLVLLKSTGAGPFGDQRDQVTSELVEGALRHFGRDAALPRGRTFVFGLEEIYRNYVASLVHILETFEGPEEIRAAIGTYERYHLVGLQAFFSA